MFADILELTQFRKIAGHKVEINGAAIAFPEEIEMPDAIRPYCLAIISIGFDKEDVVAQINRANGELYLATTSIHLSKIIGKERYPAIKQAVYQVLIDYLENKDEDIEEKLCATPGIRPKSMWQKARHSIKKIFVPEPEPAEKEPDAGAAPEPPSFWDPSRAAPAGREERNGKFTLSNLRGLKAERVIAALTRLLGPAVRVTGSHHFFQTRDGRTYPISVHPGKAVGTGLLRKCLNQMGVTPEELYATL
jgi:predicted RNA binding protein YcfA (HicA-like mRNA interferase family)